MELVNKYNGILIAAMIFSKKELANGVEFSGKWGAAYLKVELIP